MQGNLIEGASPRLSDNQPVVYAGKPRLTQLLVKNFFLTIVTAGVYRFWAATRVRRYFWSNIQLADDTFEYTGTGNELFIGFLIAMAVLVPLFIAYVIVERLTLGNPWIAGALQSIYFLTLIMLFQIAAFRSRRYRLSRTMWRGIYAAQTGSTWTYLGLSLFYGFLTVVTLGLASPWASVALERYKLNHTWFGDHPLAIEASGRHVFLPWLLALLLFALPIIVALGAKVGVFSQIAQMQGPPATRPLLILPHPVALWLLLVTVFAGVPALVAYQVVWFRYLASHIRLGTSRLRSTASSMRIMRITILFGLAVIAFFVIVMAITATLVAAIAAISHPVPGQAPIPAATLLPILGFAVLYVVLLLGIHLMSYWWLRVPILQHLATTMEIENFSVVQEITQSTQPRQKYGIGDSFELGAF